MNTFACSSEDRTQRQLLDSISDPNLDLVKVAVSCYSLARRFMFTVSGRPGVV